MIAAFDQHDPDRLPPHFSNCTREQLEVIYAFFDHPAIRRFYTRMLFIIRTELVSRELEQASDNA